MEKPTEGQETHRGLLGMASEGAGGNKHDRAPAASPTGEIIVHSLVFSVKATAARRMMAQQLDSCNEFPDRNLCFEISIFGPFWRHCGVVIALLVVWTWTKTGERSA